MKPEDLVPIVISCIAVVVALAALGVSIWAAISSHRSANAAEGMRTIEQERRDEEKSASRRSVERDAAQAEAARHANLRINVPSNNRLRIANAGPDQARDIVVTVDSANPPSPAPDWFGGLGCEDLVDGAEKVYDFLGPSNSAIDIDVHVTWTDTAGPHNTTGRVSRVLYGPIV